MFPRLNFVFSLTGIFADFIMETSYEWIKCMSSIPCSWYLIYPVPWYSVLIVAGILLAVILACREEKRQGLPKDTVIDLALWILPCGVIGARIYYVVFSWDQFRNDLWSVFRIWEGGIAIYGGIIGGLAALLFFCRRRSLSPLVLCDIIVPGLALAQGIGRWGNWFNIEAYGITVTNESPADGYAWHLAAFFYESVWDICVFLLLILLRKKSLHEKGDVFCFYLFLYAAGRLVIEETRIDSLYLSPSVRISQLISVLLCLCILIRYILRARGNGSMCSPTNIILIPLASAGILFSLTYAVCGTLFVSWPFSRSILFLTGSALLMTLCLFSLRFSSSFKGVIHADD